MRGLRLLLGGAVVAAMTVACVEAPKVIQGTVVSLDGGTREVVVRDEKPPNQEMRLSLQGADIGAEPEVGDLVRVAYLEREAGPVALRVMNLTKQAELAGKGK